MADKYLTRVDDKSGKSVAACLGNSEIDVGSRILTLASRKEAASHPEPEY